MKKAILISIFGFITLNCLGQHKISCIDNIVPIDIKEFLSYNKQKNKVFKQFVVPVESDGISINNGITIKIEGLSNSNNYTIRLEAINTPEVYLINEHIDVNNGTAIYNAFTFNGNSPSTVYRLIVLNSVIEENFKINISGTLQPFEHYIVTERNKTGTFLNSNTNFKYKINWVDYWLNNHANPLQFKIDAEEALKFSWQKQINDWGLCDGVLNNQPIDDDNEFDLNLNKKAKDFIINYFI